MPGPLSSLVAACGGEGPPLARSGRLRPPPSSKEQPDGGPVRTGLIGSRGSAALHADPCRGSCRMLLSGRAHPCRCPPDPCRSESGRRATGPRRAGASRSCPRRQRTLAVGPVVLGAALPVLSDGWSAALSIAGQARLPNRRRQALVASDAEMGAGDRVGPRSHAPRCDPVVSLTGEGSRGPPGGRAAALVPMAARRECGFAVPAAAPGHRGSGKPRLM